MLHKSFRFLPIVLLAAVCGAVSCTSTGDLKNPFVKEKPFAPTAVPADFALVIDENHDNFYERQHIQQVITAADAVNRVTYTTFRDRNDVVSDRFSQEVALGPGQLQAMWDEVARHDLLQHSSLWINWHSGADIYQHDAYTIQIRANGRTRTYRQTNGFSTAVRPLMLQVNVARLPVSPENAPVITSATPTATQPRPQP